MVSSSDEVINIFTSTNDQLAINQEILTLYQSNVGDKISSDFEMMEDIGLPNQAGSSSSLQGDQ